MQSLIDSLPTKPEPKLMKVQGISESLRENVLFFSPVDQTERWYFFFFRKIISSCFIFNMPK